MASPVAYGPVRSRNEILEWESRWSVPAGLATFVGVALVVASALVIGSVSGDGEAELLRSAHENSSSVTLSSILQAGGFLLIVAPLLVLFRAVAARSDRVRYALIGVVVAAPIFLSVAALLNATATNEAATEFVEGRSKPGITAKEAAQDCQDELKDVGAEEFREEFGDSSPAQALKRCASEKFEDEKAIDAVAEASTRGAATGFALGGRLGLAFALFYSCLHAMRVGLLSRFWGSLGMALGVAAILLLVQFTMIFFIYLGLLLLGKLPGGRPPAWEAGEAVPWPTPGEKAAEELEPAEEGESSSDRALGEERRKRKQRD
jgi:hypothetical protein